ncbi:MAG: class II SORL domain-containing protein [Pseudomonadales bacterium]|nr:class II SORL domain-containing protein [Pseudomonadales bacterium]
MNRRSLMQASGLGLAGAFLMGKANAGSNPKFAGSVYYTSENPGRWAKKVSGHAPVVQAETKSGKKVVTVTTPHEMVNEHFIVKHTLFDEQMNLLGERVFDPAKDKAAISSYSLEGVSGKVYAVSVCNKHDTWLTEAVV